MNIQQKIENILSTKIVSSNNVSGGCINDSIIVKTSDGNFYFIKSNNNFTGMYIKEANGLNELCKAKVIKIPSVIYADNNLLILENIESGKRRNDFYEEFGRSFAKLHKFTNDKFGFYEDNYIGSTIQKNSYSNSWLNFYVENRLKFQIDLCKSNGINNEELFYKFHKLLDKIDQIISDSEKPSLLHGDLWSGNYLTDRFGKPVLIDPAVYYGNREADLAMTKLFGGFTTEFYTSYNQEYPLLAGWEYRENIYKLYHILNHLNLFGSSYYYQAISLLDYYL